MNYTKHKAYKQHMIRTTTTKQKQLPEARSEQSAIICRPMQLPEISDICLSDFERRFSSQTM